MKKSKAAVIPAKAGTSCRRRVALGPRPPLSRGLRSGELETLHPAPRRRVTLTDCAKGGPTPFPVRGPSNRKRPYGLRQPPPPGPSTRTGNVQLYLSESRRTPVRMSGPLVGFGDGVKLCNAWRILTNKGPRHPQTPIIDLSSHARCRISRGIYVEEMIDSNFQSAEEVKSEILSGKFDAFVSNRILEPIPFAFGDDFSGWVEWKSNMAELIDVDPKDVVLTGSAAIGFSLNPRKSFKSFDDKSDFDCGIISPYHFDLAWRYLRDQRVSWLSLSREQKIAIKEHRGRHVFDGAIATEKILHLLPFGSDWGSALDLMSNLAPANGRAVNLRIYRDYQSLRHYNTRNLFYLRDTVLAPTVESEPIPVDGYGEEPVA